MERQARPPENTALAEPVRDMHRFDDRPIADLEAVLWRPPPGWEAPEWLPEEPPASLPMDYRRFQWCVRAIGWSLNEVGRRIHTDEGSVRQMGRGRRLIPDTLAIWLEMLAARTLNGPLEPDGWRPKPMIGHDGVPIRTAQ